MSYRGGVKAGNFINNYLYRDNATRLTRDERKQIRQDNAEIVLRGRETFDNLTDHERKSRGRWD